MYMENATGQAIASAIGNINVDTSALMKDVTGQAINRTLGLIKTVLEGVAAPEAEDVSYVNTSSGLTADNVQAAIDELADEKQNNLTYGSISTGDLNNYKQNAYIWCSGMNSISNGPVNTGYGILEVMRCSATIYMQRFTVFATSGSTMYNTYVRYYGNNQWYSWARIY